MEDHPLFQHSDKPVSLDEQRHISIKRMYAIYNERFLPMEKVLLYKSYKELSEIHLCYINFIF